MPFRVNPIRPRGGPCFCTYLCKYTYKRVEKNLTSPNYKFGRGQYAFYPVKLSRFAKKKIKFHAQPKNNANKVPRWFFRYMGTKTLIYSH